MSVRILEGDMRNVVRSLPPASFDLIVADQPYGQTALTWDRRVPGWPAIVRPLLKPSGSLWVFGSLRVFMETAGEFLNAGWRLSHDVIWEKQNGSGFATDRFRGVHEQIAHFYRDDAPWSGVYRKTPVTYDALAKKVHARSSRLGHTGDIGATFYESEPGGPRQMRSVLHVRNGHRKGTGHGTPKPAELIEPLLTYGCPPGGSVLDPFAGTGVTGLVAQRLGLEATLIEADPGAAANLRAQFSPVGQGLVDLFHHSKLRAGQGWAI